LRSLITAVALQSDSVWVHDAQGERQISRLEGNAAYAKFTPDGSKLCYRIVKAVPRFGTARDPGELWVTDLVSGRSDRIAPEFEPLDYDVCATGPEVVMEVSDAEGKSQLWLASLDHKSIPKQIPNVEGQHPLWGPHGEVFFRRIEGSSAFVYQVKRDGTGLRKAIDWPILSFSSVSPDGQWIEGWAPLGAGRPSAVQLFLLAGGPSIVIGSNTWLQWSPRGDVLWISGGPVRDSRIYAIPLRPGKLVPKMHADGFHSEEEIAQLPGARRIDAAAGAPGPSSNVYAYERRTIQRNLYSIPIP